MAITQAEIDAMLREADGLSREAASTNNRLDALEAETSRAIEQMQRQAAQDTAAILAQGEAMLASVEATMQTAMQNLDGIQNGIGDIQQETREMRQEIAGIQQSIAHIQETIAGMQVEIADTQADIAGLQRDVNGLREAHTKLALSSQARFETQERRLMRLERAQRSVPEPESGRRGTAGQAVAALHEHHRPAPLYAEGYEKHDLTAAAHDVQQLTAAEYDNQGGTLLAALCVAGPLTAREYDWLELAAEEYAGYDLAAWLYDIAGGYYLAGGG